MAWRQWPVRLLLLFGLPVLTIIVPREVNPARGFFFITLSLYFFMILPLVCLTICGAMIRDEIQGDTLGYLLTRPQTRAGLYLAKYLSSVGWLQILLAVESGLFLLAGLARGVPHLWSMVPIVLGVQVLAVAAWSALSGLFGLLTKNYIVWGIVYGFMVELGIGRIPTNINTLSLTVNIKTLLANHQELARLCESSPDKTGTALAVMALSPIVLGLASAFLFTWREYLYSQEFQK